VTWTPPATATAGTVATAAFWNTYSRDNFKAIGDAWGSYTPAWTATTTNPVIGNGTITGNYIAAGKLIIGRFRIQAGSTTTYGSGAYLISLPVSANSGLSEAAAGTADCYDSGTAHYLRFMYIDSSLARFALVGTANDFVTPTVPYTMGNGDIISGTFTYEAA